MLRAVVELGRGLRHGRMMIGLVTIPRILEFIHAHAATKFDIAGLAERAEQYEVLGDCVVRVRQSCVSW